YCSGGGIGIRIKAAFGIDLSHEIDRTDPIFDGVLLCERHEIGLGNIWHSRGSDNGLCILLLSCCLAERGIWPWCLRLLYQITDDREAFSLVCSSEGKCRQENEGYHSAQDNP